MPLAPMHPARALAPLRKVTETALVHTAVIETQVRVKTAPTKYDVSWVSETAQPALLTMAGAGGLNTRADQPSVAGDWMLALVRGAVIHEGQRVLVRGTSRDGEGNPMAWQRLVSVTKVLDPKVNELRRRALCSDVELVA